jgi:hypothetical protein
MTVILATKADSGAVLRATGSVEIDAGRRTEAQSEKAAVD